MRTSELEPYPIRDLKPWKIYRDGRLCAELEREVSTKLCIAQLKKLHPNSEFKVQYKGANIGHCGPGGTPLV